MYFYRVITGTEKFAELVSLELSGTFIPPDSCRYFIYLQRQVSDCLHAVCWLVKINDLNKRWKIWKMEITIVEKKEKDNFMTSKIFDKWCYGKAGFKSGSFIKKTYNFKLNRLFTFCFSLLQKKSHIYIIIIFFF